MTISDHLFQRQLVTAREGDARAYRWIWDRYAGPITGFLMARGTPEVDEAVNDVFLAAFERLDSFDGSEGDFQAWLYAIARNKRADQIRRWSRRGVIAGHAVADRPAVDDVEVTVLEQFGDEELLRLLRSLTPDQRDVIVLRFVAGLSLGQTAIAVDKPTGAVKALQHRALAQLRKTTSTDPYPNASSPAM